MHRRDRLYRLEFNDETLVYKQVEAALSDRESFVVHTDGNLALERYFSEVQFYGESFFVDGLEEPRSEISVHFQSCIHHLGG
jgi:hypothetical protein